MFGKDNEIHELKKENLGTNIGIRTAITYGIWLCKVVMQQSSLPILR